MTDKNEPDYKEMVGFITNDKIVNQLVEELETAVGIGDQEKLESLLDELIKLGEEKKIAFEKARMDITKDSGDSADLLVQLISLKMEFLKLSQGAMKIIRTLDRATEQGNRIFAKIIDYAKKVNLATDEEIATILSKYGS